MDNFRGFAKTLVPLKKTNFLVGENSTGKSSFLSLLSLVNQSSFWLNPVFTLRDDLLPSSFVDVVSAWSRDPSYFQVGTVTTEHGNDGRVRLTFAINEFTERDDRPKLARHTKLRDNRITTVVFEKSKTRYQVRVLDDSFAAESDAVEAFNSLLEALVKAQKTLSHFLRMCRHIFRCLLLFRYLTASRMGIVLRTCSWSLKSRWECLSNGLRRYEPSQREYTMGSASATHLKVNTRHYF